MNTPQSSQPVQDQSPVTPIAPVPPSAAQASPNPNGPKPKGPLKILLIIGGTVLLLIILTISGLLLLRKDTGKTTTQQQSSNAGLATYETDCYSVSGPQQGSNNYTVTVSADSCSVTIRNSKDGNLGIRMSVLSRAGSIDALATTYKEGFKQSSSGLAKVEAEKKITVNGVPAIRFVTKDGDGITRLDSIVQAKKSYSNLGNEAGHAFLVEGYGFREDMVRNYDAFLDSVRWK